MHENIKIEPGQYGLKATLLGGWSSEVCEYLLDTKIAELELNQGKGWRGNDIEFINKFTSLKAFSLLDLSFKDISPIHLLKGVVDLTLVTYSKTKLDFSHFPELKIYYSGWNNCYESIFNCYSVEDLCIDGYKGKDLRPFGRLNRIKKLTLLNNSSVTNLIGISCLKNLHYLRLANYKKLNSLEGLERLYNIEYLEINTCKKLKLISEISGLENLKRLHLDNNGDISSLRPLRGNSNLEVISFAESTNILDGDINVLLELKNLSLASFMNRRHYSHKKEEF